MMFKVPEDNAGSNGGEALLVLGLMNLFGCRTLMSDSGFSATGWPSRFCLLSRMSKHLSSGTLLAQTLKGRCSIGE